MSRQLLYSLLSLESLCSKDAKSITMRREASAEGSHSLLGADFVALATTSDAAGAAGITSGFCTVSGVVAIGFRASTFFSGEAGAKESSVLPFIQVPKKNACNCSLLLVSRFIK